jgi:acetyl esterase/lipase
MELIAAIREELKEMPSQPICSLRALCMTFLFNAVFAAGLARGAETPSVDPDGTVHVPAFLLPESSLLGNGTRAVLKAGRENQEDAALWKACPSIEGAMSGEAPAIHKCEWDAFHASSFYKRLRERYAVAIASQVIGGIRTAVFTPAAGVASSNRRRVLINVHGGGFLGGWGTNSEVESVPIAAEGKIRIVSIDYREGPEHEFPAASEDVAAVYRELLKTYKPGNIGIYGCSAGGLMTAETVAWLEKERLPLPGAVAMLCAAASYWSDGDSGYLVRAMEGTNLILEGAAKNPYFKHVKPTDALAFPVQSTSVMAGFPPSLLITGTRDFALSSVVHTHSVLVAEGVKAYLHVWEGLGHAFFYDIDLPESKEVYAAMVGFFNIHLGT